MCFFKVLFQVFVSFVFVSLYSNCELEKKLDQCVQKHKNFNGAVLVAKGGEVILKKGYGYSSFIGQKRNDPSTVFHLASLSKSFTAVAIMLLQEEGLLSVHDVLGKYLGDYSDGSRVTIHHLLTHTSGVVNYYKKWENFCYAKGLLDMIEIIKSWPLEFEPGSAYSYSNTGYMILAYIIEKVSGKRYEKYVRDNILEPLGMHSTGFVQQLGIKNLAQGYIQQDDEIEVAPSIISPQILVGNGDVCSSLDDLYKWDQAFSCEKILSKDTIDCIFKPHFLMKEPLKRSHGYGWFVDELRGKKVVEYTGALRGFLARYIKFIEDDVSIVVLSNVEDSNNRNQIFEIADTLITCIFG